MSRYPVTRIAPYKRGRRPTDGELNQLYYAIQGYDVSKLEKLLSQDDIDVDTKLFRFLIGYNWPLVSYAACCNSIRCVKKIVELGANITAKDDDGNTPLMFSADYNKTDAINYLVRQCNLDYSNLNQKHQQNIKEALRKTELEIENVLTKDITKSVQWPIDEELSKELFVSTLADHLECEICHDVLIDPVQTSCCGQSYCRKCIEQVRNNLCPHCRESLEHFPDKKSIRFINGLEVKCPYHIDDKCKWTGTSSELKNHLKVCDVKPLLCPLGCGQLLEKKRNMVLHEVFMCNLRSVLCKYCQKQVVHKDMAKHHDVCPKMPLPCPNSCSSKSEIKREDMEKHLEVCPEQVLLCKYSEFGCAEKVKRKEYDRHLSSAMEQHLYLAADTARSARKELEERISVLEKKFLALQK